MSKTVVAFAPGRMELLGNDAHCNEGLVLAAAIDPGVTARAERLEADLLEVTPETNGRQVTVGISGLKRP
jgi:galactokinase